MLVAAGAFWVATTYLGATAPVIFLFAGVSTAVVGTVALGLVFRQTVEALKRPFRGPLAVVVPPSDPPDPVSVYLLKDGRHTGLLMPAPDGGLARYTYGEWEWYALIHKGFFRAIAALFWPTQATLGRHFYPGPATEERVRELFGEMCRGNIYSVTVSRRKVDALLERLGRLFEEHIETRIVNETYGLEFVKHPQPYWIFHDSNHQVALWLRELGCEVGGMAIFARWVIKPPRAANDPDRSSPD